METKDQIADDKYGYDFDDLETGQKAAVTRAYNAQRKTRRVTRSNAGVKATIGRIGVNGTKTCILEAGATIQDLLDQSEYGFDRNKEKILDSDTGNAVTLSTKVKNNATYAISVEIKSAF